MARYQGVEVDDIARRHNTRLHYLRSDGIAGSHADAATSAPARVILPGTAKPVCTVHFWVRTGRVFGCVFQASDDGAPSVQLLAGNGSWDPNVFNAAGADIGPEGSLSVGPWHQIAIVCDGTNMVYYKDGSQEGSDAMPATPYAAVDALRLFDTWDGTDQFRGDIRGFAVFDRDLDAGEVESLHTAGPAHDLLVAIGGYTGAPPVHYWPGANWDGGIVDEGTTGGCLLVLYNGVTRRSIEDDVADGLQVLGKRIATRQELVASIDGTGIIEFGNGESYLTIPANTLLDGDEVHIEALIRVTGAVSGDFTPYLWWGGSSGVMLITTQNEAGSFLTGAAILMRAVVDIESAGSPTWHSVGFWHDKANTTFEPMYVLYDQATQPTDADIHIKAGGNLTVSNAGNKVELMRLTYDIVRRGT